METLDLGVSLTKGQLNESLLLQNANENGYGSTGASSRAQSGANTPRSIGGYSIDDLVKLVVFARNRVYAISLIMDSFHPHNQSLTSEIQANTRNGSEAPPPTRAVVLNCTQVSGIDASASRSCFQLISHFCR